MGKMGLKLKRTGAKPKEEDKQKKISSFFKGKESSKTSSLFSQINPKSAELSSSKYRTKSQPLLQIGKSSCVKMSKKVPFDDGEIIVLDSPEKLSTDKGNSNVGASVQDKLKLSENRLLPELSQKDDKKQAIANTQVFEIPYDASSTAVKSVSKNHGSVIALSIDEKKRLSKSLVVLDSEAESLVKKVTNPLSSFTPLKFKSPIGDNVDDYAAESPDIIFETPEVKERSALYLSYCKSSLDDSNSSPKSRQPNKDRSKIEIKSTFPRRISDEIKMKETSQLTIIKDIHHKESYLSDDAKRHHENSGENLRAYGKFCTEEKGVSAQQNKCMPQSAGDCDEMTSDNKQLQSSQPTSKSLKKDDQKSGISSEAASISKSYETLYSDSEHCNTHKFGFKSDSVQEKTRSFLLFQNKQEKPNSKKLLSVMKNDFLPSVEKKMELENNDRQFSDSDTITIISSPENNMHKNVDQSDPHLVECPEMPFLKTTSKCPSRKRSLKSKVFEDWNSHLGNKTSKISRHEASLVDDQLLSMVMDECGQTSSTEKENYLKSDKKRHSLGTSVIKKNKYQYKLDDNSKDKLMSELDSIGVDSHTVKITKDEFASNSNVFNISATPDENMCDELEVPPNEVLVENNTTRSNVKRKLSISESLSSTSVEKVRRIDDDVIIIDEPVHFPVERIEMNIGNEPIVVDHKTKSDATETAEVQILETIIVCGDNCSIADTLTDNLKVSSVPSIQQSLSKSISLSTIAKSTLSSSEEQAPLLSCHENMTVCESNPEQLQIIPETQYSDTATLVNDHIKDDSGSHPSTSKDEIGSNVCGTKFCVGDNGDILTSFDMLDDSLMAALDCNVFADDDSGKKSDFCFTQLWQRFVVKSVSEDRTKGEKCLGLAKKPYGYTSHHCILTGCWEETQVKEGNIVNVLASFVNHVCTITDSSGFLIVNPDMLISSTTIVSSLFCKRKSVLKEIVKSKETVGSQYMFFGTLLHSLFQAVLKDRVIDKQEVIIIARQLMSSSKFLHEMFSNSITESKVWEEVNEYIPPLISWVSKHREPGCGGTSKGKENEDIIVTDVQDIEESIWSPKLGIKGKIDLTVKVRPRNQRYGDQHILPLELKTGKASFSPEHKGQVILYSMMYGDRRKEPGEGILLYLKQSDMEIVKAKPHSQSGLIQLRNSMSYYLSNMIEEIDKRSEGNSVEYGTIKSNSFQLNRLPKPISNQRACSKCSHLLSCCLYQKAVENTSPADKHPMNQLITDSLGHLNEEDLDYFRHWVLCLSIENLRSSKGKLKEIWTKSSQERERLGDCLSHMVVVSSKLGIQETQGFTEGKGCSLTFIRQESYHGAKLDEVGLNVNDMVVVSSEDGRLIALTTGFIRNISDSQVEVVVDRDNLHDTSLFKDILFRLDKNDNFSTHATLLANMCTLMEATPHALKMRKLIIAKRPPSFEMKIPMPWVKKIKPIFKDLNKPQKAAILKILMAKDYVLIRGFPGTGKTSLIVALIKVLQTLGMSVLFTSYTHSAVDNIAVKLKKDGVHFLRLGRQGRIHPNILSHSAEILTTRLKSVQELADFYDSYSVVATSCLGMTHQLFTHRRFDVCVVDEASQVLQPACLGPLFSCNKFILVGDGQQLPPLVQSNEARQLGMDESLFVRLQEQGATYDLNWQYRMNQPIMAVSNMLVYDGKLVCGNTQVANRCLNVDSSPLQGCPPWLTQALSSDLHKSVIFIDTRQVGDSSCTNKGSSSSNETEAQVVIQLLDALTKLKVDCSEIGVISPYRSQVKLLMHKKDIGAITKEVEVNTIDQYQGRDKAAIIVSLVYNGADGMSAELLKDVRRLNVALTRAQCKLILVGNGKALESLSHFRLLLDHLHHSKSILLLEAEGKFVTRS